MKKQKHALPEPGILKQKAELILEKNTLKNGAYLSENDPQRLLQELQVHQIELELQNEELRRAKEEAELASQKYTELYDFAPTGYFTLNQKGLITELNLSGANMLGKPRSYLINSNFSFFVSYDTKSIFNLFLQKIFSNKTKQTCEVTITADGNLPVYLYLKGIVSENGEHCIVNAFDISEKRKAEEILQESRERNHTIILQTAMDGFWLVDMKGKLLEVNETYCRMSGYSVQELLLMSVHDLEAIESENDTFAHMRKILDHGEDFFESKHRRKDGSIFDVEISVQYQSVKGGRFVAFIRNITERKRSEEKLSESEKRYRSLFEDSNDAIFLLDLESGNYVDCNKLAEKLTGYTREEILTQKTGAFLPAQLKNEAVSNIELIVSRNLLRKETEIMSRDGKIIPVEFNSSKIEIDKKHFILSMLHDISDRKAAEDALKQSEESIRVKLQSILSPEGSISGLELNDIIDAPSIQKLMDHFYELVHIPMAIIDLKGKVLVGVGWQDICTKFHRVHPESCRNCFESDVYLTQGINDGEFKLYKCKNNMWDMATPLIIGGEHKGNLYLGQFFFENEPIEFEIFSNQAHQYSFDEKEYLDALSRVPRLNKHKLDHAKAFFLNLSLSISQLSYSNIKLARAITQQKKIDEELREKEDLLNKAQEIAHLGSWSLDLVKNELTWSDELYRIFDLQPQEFPATYEGFLDFVHPEDRDAVNAAYTNSILENQDSYEIEHRVIRNHSGEIRYVKEKCEHVRDASGKIILSVGMAHDISELKQSEEELQQLNEELETRVKERTEELLQLNIELKQLQKNILNAIIQTEEKERAYFSKELHDGLGPLLSTIRLYLQWSERPKIHESWKEIISKAEDLLEDALTTVKEISNKLSPHLLANYGLTVALQRFIENIRDTREINIMFESNINRRFDVEIESTLYRGIIECINNTIKHAGAKTVSIYMVDTGEHIQIQYLDDGIGFDLDETLASKKGLGLFNLQNRIQNIGGKIEMFSKPEHGINYQIVVAV